MVGQQKMTFSFYDCGRVNRRNEKNFIMKKEYLLITQFSSAFIFNNRKKFNYDNWKLDD